MVYAELATPGARRTVIFYAHYDGQPVDARTLRGQWLPELITTDEAAYIALAHRLGTETTYRRQLNERILAGMARRPKFINTLAYARGLGALLESLVRVK